MTTSGEVSAAESAKTRLLFRLAGWGLILIGAMTRVRVYLADRSLWRDEAALALNITRRSFFGLFRPLDNDQAAPVGFLLIQKLVVSILGDSEYALRLWPLVASIVGMVFFWLLVQRTLGIRAALVAIAVLALGFKQIYYASENKQYSTDVLVAIAMLVVTIKTLAPGELSPKQLNQRFGIFAACGALAIWFSHPAIFVLGGIAVMGLIELAARPDRRLRWLAAVGVWIVSFALAYLLVLHRLSRNDFMQSFWSTAGAFAPVPKSFGAFTWYKKSFFELFEDPGSLPFTGLAAFAYVAGIAAIYRRKRSLLAALVLPIVLALGASMVHKYPFKSRMVLFIAPLLAIPIGAGIEFLCDAQNGRGKWIGILAAVILFISPVMTNIDYATHPPRMREIRDSLSFASKNLEPNDLFYVYPFCQYGFDFYKNRFGLQNSREIVGTQNISGWNDYSTELSKLSGSRVWVLFEDTTDHDGMNEQQMAIHILDGLGKRAAAPTTQPFGEFVACYDLRR